MAIENNSNMLFEFEEDNGLIELEVIHEEEEEEEVEVEESDDEGSLFSIDFREIEGDKIYVAVGINKKNNIEESSMDALLWTLKHAVIPSSTIVYLIHVFPFIRFIPSPLGMIPRSQVCPRLVEKCLALERERRKKLLQNYIDACSAAQVKVETLLIESEMVAKAIIDLIPTLNIRKLVVGLGITKSSPRKTKSKRSGIAKVIIQNNASETCDIKIISNGKEMINQLIESPSSSSSSSSSPYQNSNSSFVSTQEDQDQQLTLSTPITDQMKGYPRHFATHFSEQIWNVFKWKKSYIQQRLHMSRGITD